MNRHIETKRSGGRSRWVVGATVTVAALIYLEQTALVFVLSTLAICGLFLVIAFSDLEGGVEE